MKNLFALLISIFVSLSCVSQTWSTVGSGATNGRIQAMCVYNGELYVGGYFDSIGGLNVNSIARWDGISWDSVPGAYAFYPFEIFDMVVYQNQLIVVGTEVRAWNDTSWTSLNLLDNRQFGANVGTGLDSLLTNGDTTQWGQYWSWEQINVGCVYNNELYVGGTFISIGGLQATNIARWHMIGASIDDGETTQTVSVFPNPANNEIAFQFGDADESRSVVICNSTGQAVGKYSANQNTLRISIAAFAEGIYFYSCIEGQGTGSSGRFLIVH